MTTLALMTAGTLVMAVLLGIREFGVLAQGMAFAQLVYAFGLFGMDQLILQGRATPRVTAVRFGTAATLVGMCAFMAATQAVGDAAAKVALVLLVNAVLSGLVSAGLVFDHQLRGAEARAKREFAFRVSVVAAGLVGAAFGNALVGATALLLGTSVAGAALLLTRRPSGQARSMSDAPLRAAVPYAAIAVLFSALSATIGVIAADRLSVEANASLRVCLQAYAGVVGVAGALNVEYFRARLYRTRGLARREEIRRMLRLSFAVGAGLGLAVAVGGQLLVVILDHDGYADLRLAFVILGAAAFLLVVESALGSVVIADGKPSVSVTRGALVLTVALALMLLIPLSVPAITGIFVLASALGLVTFARPFVRALRSNKEESRHG